MKCDFSQTTDLQELLYYSVFFNDAEYDSVPSLFHFTNKWAKEKIVGDEYLSLKLTRVKDFEDRDEGRHISQVYDSVCCEFLQQRKDKEFFDLMRSVKAGFDLFLENNRDKYVFCFSKSENNRYLIENYAHKNGETGYRIGFQALQIENLADNDGIDLVDVIYDKGKLAQSMKNVILKTYQLRGQDNNCETLRRILLNQLLVYSLCYKSPDFKSEEETRLIVTLPQPDNLPFRIIQDNLYLELDKGALYHLRSV